MRSPDRVLVEGLDRAHRQHLEDVVVAHPTGRVARARLLLAEDRERHARGVQARRDRPGDLLVARVEGRRAADPVQDLEVVELPAAATSATVRTSNGSGFVQSIRADDGWPHGLPWPSIARNAPA